MEPIDFLKLYKEERRRTRQDNKIAESKDEFDEEATKVSLSVTPTPMIDIDNIEPIDFKALVEQERFARKMPEWKFASPSALLTMDIGEVADQVDVSGVSYKPRFVVDLDYQKALVDWLQELPINTRISSEKASIGKWTALPHAKRRVAVFQTRPCLPTPIQMLVDSVAHLFSDDRPPNHVLVNEYEPHQGIMPHTDGPAYDDCTATVSLGSGSVLLQFVHDIPSSSFQVLLEGNGSLVVFRNAAYSQFKHGIDEGTSVEEANETCRNAPQGTAVERHYRISITIRHKRS